MKIKHVMTVLTACAGLLAAWNCSGVAISFNVASGDWNTPGNWSPAQVPVAADTVTIPTGRTVSGLGGVNQACTSITIQGTGRLVVDANTLTVSGGLTVGSSGVANLTIESSGTLNIPGTAAWGFGGTGSSITNHGILICNAGNSSTAGSFVNNGVATFTGTGQSFNNNGSIIQGPNAVLNLNANNSTPIGASPTMLFTNVGNTVSYGPTIDINTRAGSYHILAFTNSGRRSMGNPTVINNKLSIRGNNEVNFGTAATYGAGATLEYKGSVAQSLSFTPQAFPTTAGPANLIIDNPSGFTLNSGRMVTGMVALVSGTFSSANNLTLGVGATVIRGAGSFSGAPVFGSSVNVTYNHTSATTTGSELPTSASVLNNLTLSNLAGVNLNANATVNGTFTALYASGTPALAVGTRTLTLGNAPIAILVSGTPLSVDNSYTIVSKTSGSVTATPGTLTINGDSAPYPPPYTGSTVSAATGELVLTIPPSNADPVANTDNYSELTGSQIKFKKADLLANDTDADDDPLTITSFSTTSPGGKTLTADATHLYYPGTLNANDSFTYTISDGNGGTAVGTVNITALDSVTGQVAHIEDAEGAITLTFAGIPGYAYEVERATDASFTMDLTSLLTTNLPASPPVGVFSYTDNSPPNPQAYYRLKFTAP